MGAVGTAFVANHESHGRVAPTTRRIRLDVAPHPPGLARAFRLRDWLARGNLRPPQRRGFVFADVWVVSAVVRRQRKSLGL